MEELPTLIIMARKFFKMKLGQLFLPHLQPSLVRISVLKELKDLFVHHRTDASCEYVAFLSNRVFHMRPKSTSSFETVLAISDFVETTE